MTWQLYVVRVDPGSELIPDVEEPEQHDLGIWMLESALADDLVIPIEQAQDEVRWWLRGEVAGDYLDAMVFAFVYWALAHPKTPLALGFRPACSPASIAGEPSDPEAMTVLWHGDAFHRDRDGVLTPLGFREESWPTAEEWRRMLIAARMSVRASRRRRSS